MRFRHWPASFLAILCLHASEHRGAVKFNNLPVPGATVTATQGDKTVTAITDREGAYRFPDLADGPWKLHVEMLCFVPMHRDIKISSDAAPNPDWDLKMLPFDQIRASAGPPGSAAARFLAAAPSPSPAPAPDAPPPPPIDPDLTQRAADGFLINGNANNSASSPFALLPAFGNNRKGPGSLYNGSLGFIADNSALDARSFSITGQDTPKPAYNHLTGLLSFGGPIKIPRLLKNGPNVIVNYQWTRNRNASTLTGLMPTLAQRNGDFISPQAKALLALYPLPNFDGGNSYNYQFAAVGNTHQDSLQSRANKTIGRRDQLSGNFAYQSTRADTPTLFSFLDTTDSAGINTGANWRHNFTSRFQGVAGYQFSRMTTRVTPFFENRTNISGQAGIRGNNQDPLNWGPPSLSFASGISQLTDVQQSLTRNQTSALSVSGFWNHGRHNVSFGTDIRRQQFNLLSQQDARGSFTFTGAATGSDFADFLLGVPDTSSIAFGNADKYLRAWSNDAYATDDWRITPGLTLNAGGRWEYGSPMTELYGRLVNFVAATPPLIHPDKHGFQPRIGLSWRPFPASSMVVRAGYGVYYNTSVYLAIATQMAQQAPLSKSLSVQNSPDNPLTLANGFNASARTTPNTFAIDPNFRVGYSQNWQLSVQSDLPGALVLSTTYLGIKGTRGVQESLPNTFPLGAADPCPTCPRGFVYMTSNGNSTRASGQIQLRRRLQRGFTASLQYTYSKSIDDTLGFIIAQDWLNLSGERGLSNFDQRHLLNAQAQYTGYKEWVLSTTITAGTGLPLTPIYLAAVNGTGVTGSIRPDYLGPNSYRAPAPGQWGNAGRNTITGPGQFTLNASLGRTFRIGDRISLDFRLDSTNALNHVTYPGFNTFVTSAQFGLPYTANAMRSVQTTFRARF